MNLRESDYSAYLGNVLLVAHADEALSSHEEVVLEAVRQAIGAKKADFTKTQKLVASKAFKLSKVGPLSAQVQNLEDMVYVGLIDGNLNAPEESIISQFRIEIGLTEDQFQQVVREAEQRVRNLGAKINCPKCGQNSPADAKFCPNCGGPISAEQKVQLSFSIPDSGYAIEFAESTASNFPAALALATKAFGYQTCVKSGKTWHLAVYGGEQFDQVTALATLLSGIKNKKLHINGKEEAWDDVFGFIWCEAQRRSAYRPDEYCFGLDEKRLNLWGCKQVRMDWTEWGEWFSFGQFIKANGRNSYTWQFDKQKIVHELNSKIYKLRFCPHLNMQLIQAIIELLPDEIEVSPRSAEWSFKHSYEQVPGSVKICEKDDNGDGISWSNEYFASGVKPNGLQFARKILGEAFQRCGMNETDAHRVTA